jgi:hypothetical protein
MFWEIEYGTPQTRPTRSTKLRCREVEPYGIGKRSCDGIGWPGVIRAGRPAEDEPRLAAIQRYSKESAPSRYPDAESAESTTSGIPPVRRSPQLARQLRVDRIMRSLADLWAAWFRTNDGETRRELAWYRDWYRGFHGQPPGNRSSPAPHSGGRRSSRWDSQRSPREDGQNGVSLVEAGPSRR